MEILRQNPVNLTLLAITVPSNQKTVIRNSINTMIFSKKSEQNKPNIDYG
jgi:hypothetical protein